jgi:hypothetical protein
MTMIRIWTPWVLTNAATSLQGGFEKSIDQA